jgi:serine/threonine protein kinase
MENKYFYIISEYHKNTTLLDILLNPDIETTFKRRYKILLDVIKIVEDLHAQNIILYELKSSNIIIDNDKVYIRNYGLSKFIQARNKKCKLSALPYMAPEVIKNDYMDKASDIYSIGILMWEIFSRSKIYPEYNSTKDLKVHIFNLGRPNISELDEHTPEEIIDLMKQCWSMRSSDRSNLQDIRKAISIKLDDLLN